MSNLISSCSSDYSASSRTSTQLSIPSTKYQLKAMQPSRAKALAILKQYGELRQAKVAGLGEELIELLPQLKELVRLDPRNKQKVSNCFWQAGLASPISKKTADKELIIALAGIIDRETYDELMTHLLDGKHNLLGKTVHSVLNAKRGALEGMKKLIELGKSDRVKGAYWNRRCFTHQVFLTDNPELIDYFYKGDKCGFFYEEGYRAALKDCVRLGKANAVKGLLADDYYSECYQSCYKLGDDLFRYAASSGNAEVLKLILNYLSKYVEQTCQRCSVGESLLDVALASRDDASISMMIGLIEKDQSLGRIWLERIDKHQRSILHRAAEGASAENLQRIIKLLKLLNPSTITNLLQPDGEGQTPLDIVARRGDPACIQILLDRYPADKKATALRDIVRPVVFSANTKAILFVLKMIPTTELAKHLGPDDNRMTLLARLLGTGGAPLELVDHFLKLMKEHNVPLYTTENVLCTPFHCAALCSGDVGKRMLELLSKEDLEKLNPRALLSSAISCRNPTYLQGLLDFIKVHQPEQLDQKFKYIGASYLLMDAATASFLEGVKLLKRYLGPEAIAYEAKNTKMGSPLHAAAKSASLEVMLALTSCLNEKQLEEALGRDQDGKTPLHLLVERSPEEAIDLISALPPKALAVVLQEDKGGKSPLYSLLERYPGLLAPIEKTLSALHPEALKKLLPSVKRIVGDTNEDAAVALLKFIGTLPLDQRLALIEPSGMEAAVRCQMPAAILALGQCMRGFSKEQRAKVLGLDNPAKNALWRTSPNTETANVEALLAIMKKEELDRSYSLSSKGSRRTHSLLMKVIQAENGKGRSNKASPYLVLMIKTMSKLSTDVRTQLLEHGPDGTDLLDFAVARLNAKQAIQMVAQFYPPLVLRDRMLVSRRGETLISETREAFVHHLDAWTDLRRIARAVGSFLYTDIESYLKKRFSKEEYKVFKRIHEWIYDDDFEPKYDEDHKYFRKVTPLIGSKELHDRLDDWLLGYEERERLQEEVEAHDAWYKKVRAALELALPQINEAKVNATLPLLERLKGIKDAKLRDAITHAMGLYPLEFALDWQKTAKAGKMTPCLYTIPLGILQQRGAPVQLLKALNTRILSLGKGRGAHEGCSDGIKILKGLMALVQSPCFHKEELEKLLGLILKQKEDGDFVRQLELLTQAVAFDQGGRLGSMLRSGRCDLDQIAFEGFKKIVPIRDVADFATKYVETFGTRRYQEALATYAASIAYKEKVLEVYGEWIADVLDGQYRNKRYDEKDSEHLQAVYKARPDLKKALPQLSSEAIASSTVGELSRGGSGGFRFTLDTEGMKKVILRDQHLDNQVFPYIVEFLKAKDTKEAIAVRVKLSKAMKSLGTELKKAEDKNKQVEYQRLKLQYHLIHLCIVKDLKTLGEHLDKAIDYLREIEKAGTKYGDFRNDLDQAREALKDYRPTPLDEFTVSLSDDYWDLFLIGSEGQKSCQRVNDGGYNHCLMGYVVDGKTFAIVVKKPGEKATCARRLLRIEMIAGEDKPALFLESFYASRMDYEIDEAMIELATRIAKRLRLPLYGENGGRSDVTLESLGSRAPYVYSDAGPGATNGVYTIDYPGCIWSPDSNDASSSSSNNN